MNPMNGLLLIDKPSGPTSHDVVHKVRRILGIRGIGHAGTLDPLASGLLVLLVGEATKVSDYLLNGDKSYEVTVRLGVRTDSMDITGQVLEECAVDLLEGKIRTAVADMSGTLMLDVPVHSAVKVDGKRLYEFAHKGETPATVPTRAMHFYDVEVVAIEPTRVTVRLSCSKGSFIRAWANELGRRLGCGGAVESLKRVGSQPFDITSAITLTEIESKWNARRERHGSEIGPAWIALKDSLPHFVEVCVDGADERLLKNGQISGRVRADLLRFVNAIPENPEAALPPVRVISRETDDLLAILLAEPGQFYKIKRVFNRV
jgi:tRNA pseudouridine55 synthase